MSFWTSTGGGIVFELVDRFPHIAILASLTGMGATILAVIKVISVFLGFAGGLFSVLAGYYTFRVYYIKWKNLKRSNMQKQVQNAHDTEI